VKVCYLNSRILNPYIDIINDLLEGLEGPSITVIRGPIGSGKAFILTRIIKDWIERGRGKAVLITFMIPREEVLRQARVHGMDLEGHERSGRLNINFVSGYSRNPEERLSQLLSLITEASEEAGGGIVVFYPGDIAFGGLDANSLFSVMGLLTHYMREYGTRYFIAFTEPPPPEVASAKELMEVVARYVFDIKIEVPEAGRPRRYLVIVKPLTLSFGGSRTLEIIYSPGQGIRLATYGIMEEYEAEIDINDRLLTGLDWFDRLTGGLIRGTSLLVTGGTGTGKTVLLLTLAYSIASRGEKILYISFEEPSSQLIETLKGLGLDYSIVRGNLAVKTINPRAITLTSIFSEVVKYMDNNYSVVILDGLHSLWKEFGPRYHRFLRDIIYYLKNRRRLLLMAKIISRGEPVYTWLSSIADGIIELRLHKAGLTYERLLCFKKMRMHPIPPSCYKYDVRRGIVEETGGGRLVIQ
jgi:circadian clock protein KaiC